MNNKFKYMRKLSVLLLLTFISFVAISQNKWLDQIGIVHTPESKTQLLEASKSYFEVDVAAKLGDEVIGRVSIANNSYEQADFEIVGGTGINLFSIHKFVNSKGKHFGVLKVKELPLTDTEYTLNVKATFSNGETDTKNYTINRVETLIAEKFFNYAFSELSKANRMVSKATDDEVNNHLSKFTDDGTFSDLTYGLSKAGWEGLNNGAERISEMAMAYLDKKSSFYKNEALKQKVYTAVIFNSNEFAKYRTQWYESHLWRNTDYIAGVGINYFRLLQKEMNDENAEIAQRAVEVYDAILDNCDNLFAERMNERPALGNANRNHRMRSLVVRAAITYDYNRAITDWDVWYDKTDRRIPGFYPDGAINDLMELMETSFVAANTYNNMNGFFPDGTICHHPAVGIQFTADGYGWPWLTQWSIPLSNLFKDTPFQSQNETYNVVAERLLDSYRPLTFNGYIDMSVGGLVTDREKWGKLLLNAVTGLIEAKSTTTIIDRETELLEFKANLEKKGFNDPLSMNKAFWNIDYLVQSRPSYFASVKMISTRSRGLERGLKKKSNYYLGDGALFVRVNPDDYNGIHGYYNWHAIPGTTAEQRHDDLPASAVSAYPGANGTNTFAGVVSNGSIGLGAFIYERNHTSEKALYSTVNANKGYFFFDNEIIALGNDVRRVREGDGADIITTLNQLEWRDDITFGKVGENKHETIALSGRDAVKQLHTEKKPIWFYHNEVGYVIVPKPEQKVEIELQAQTRVPLLSKKKKNQDTKKMFQLAINHGSNVESDYYQYIVLPKTTVKNVKTFAESIGNNNIRILQNNEKQMAVYNSDLKTVQIAFYEAGELSYKTEGGENITLSVDKPAVLMMEDKGTYIEFNVSDPNHSTTKTTINVGVNMKLDGESYDKMSKLSIITFTHSSQELYAGENMFRRIKKVL